MHDLALNVALLLLANETLPVGVTGADDVSVTVAVHVVLWPARTF
jgi:hypothetical protein